MGIPKNENQFCASVAALAVLALFQKAAGKINLIFRECSHTRFACYSIKFSFCRKDRIRLEKKNKGNGYVSIYKIGGTTYEVEIAFGGGTEILNNKIIRLMLSEKIKSKGTDNSDKARYNSNTLCFVGQQKGGI